MQRLGFFRGKPNQGGLYFGLGGGYQNANLFGGGIYFLVDCVVGLAVVEE